MTVQKGQLIRYRKIIKYSEVLSLHPFGGFDDFNLPTDDALINVLFSDSNFAHLLPDQKDQALALLDQFADIFVEGPHDFGLEKSVIHHIDTGDASPFQAKPYRKSRVEEAAVLKEQKQLRGAGLLAHSKSPWASPLLILKKKRWGPLNYNGIPQAELNHKERFLPPALD